MGLITKIFYISMEVALRRGQWKWIPEIPALYDLESDLEERFNKMELEKEWPKTLAARMDEELRDWLARIEARDTRSKNGTLFVC